MKLTIELVPRPLWYKNNRIDKAKWAEMRQSAINDEHLCTICGAPGRDVHEIWEYDDANHTQRLAGLQYLCIACHEVKHFGPAARNGRSRQALAHFAKVNRISVTEARRHIEAAFRLFEKRSKREWRQL